jgi:YVTN family beta-propeller protein
MAMAGTMGWASALEVAAGVSSTDWAMDEIAQSLLWAQAYRRQPWEGLERLASERGGCSDLVNRTCLKSLDRFHTGPPPCDENSDWGRYMKNGVLVRVVMGSLLLGSGLLAVGVASAPSVGAATTPIQIQVGPQPFGLALDAKTNRLYVANFSSTVSVINTKTNAIVQTIPLNGYLGGDAVDIRTDTVYVAGGTGLYVIDGRTGTVTDTVTLPDAPQKVAVNPETDTVYTSSWTNTSDVDVIDGRTDTVVARIPTALYTDGIAVNARTNLIYVAGGAGLYVISGRTNTVVARIPNIGMYGGVTIDQKKDEIFVTIGRWDAPSVAVVDGRTNSIINEFGNQQIPTAIAVDPRTAELFVEDDLTNTIAVLNEITGAIIATYSMSWDAGLLAINQRTDTLYAVNYVNWPQPSLVWVYQGI